MAYAKKQKKGFWASVKEITVLLLIVFLIRTFGFGLYQVPTGSMETTMLIGERFFADKLSYSFITKPKRGDIISFNDPLFNYSENSLTYLFQYYVWGPSNWTKRVIALPGEHVQGKIEDGKPVVYVNGQKLDEPYLNKYPLLALWKINPIQLQKSALEQAQRMAQTGKMNAAQMNRYINGILNKHFMWRSYDPYYSYLDQPFYRMQPSLIFKDSETGERLLKYPNTPVDDEHDIFDWHLGTNQYWVMGDNRQGSHDCRFFGPLNGKLIHGKIIFRIWSIDSYESWWIIDLLKHPIDFWKRVRWSRFFQVVR